MHKIVIPGHLILVVGPSGVGKDSILDLVKCELSSQSHYIFPRRYITRPEDAGGENHMPITYEDFDVMKQVGKFAMSWQAHGQSYAISTNDIKALEAGKNVVINTSRTMINDCRQRFSNVSVISINASADILMQRLYQRGRETEEEITRRVQRASHYQVEGDDVHHINNDGALQKSVQLFLSILENLKMDNVSKV